MLKALIQRVHEHMSATINCNGQCKEQTKGVTHDEDEDHRDDNHSDVCHVNAGVDPGTMTLHTVVMGHQEVDEEAVDDDEEKYRDDGSQCDVADVGISVVGLAHGEFSQEQWLFFGMVRVGDILEELCDVEEHRHNENSSNGFLCSGYCTG